MKLTPPHERLFADILDLGSPYRGPAPDRHLDRLNTTRIGTRVSRFAMPRPAA
ncbi:hypothetical protein ACFYRD_34745 [Streptomyces hirsutus]|uniref:hypothetical protein n=1 Tax=Streptomyces hirsutus TaxID=35620 RepID=UPI0036CE4FE9